MTRLHAVPDARGDLLALLVEQQGRPSHRNPARRAAFAMAERIASDPGWYRSNDCAVTFLEGMATMSRKLASTDNLHPDLRFRLRKIADLTGM